MNNPKRSMVTAVFRDRFNADAAWRWLIDSGYGPNEINMLMSQKTRETFDAEHPEEEGYGAKTHAAEGVAAGGAVGTVLGAAAGIVAALGTSLLIPGLGIIVAGPLAAALAGGGAGAVTGGVIGGLIGLGIPEANAKAYDQILRTGGIAIGVTPRNSKDTSTIKQRFEQLHGENIVVV